MKNRLLTGPALALTAALALSGCAAFGGGASDAGATDAANTKSPYGTCPLAGTKGEFTLKTLKPDTLVVRADLPSPGWYNGDTVAQIDGGMDYCILANIAYRSGIGRIDLENASFDALIAGKGGDMDLTLNQISITPEREKIFDFSTPYYNATTAIVTKAGSKLSAANLRDAKLGVKQGTTQQLFATTTLHPTQQISVYPGDQELDAAVAAGQIDAAVQDLSVALGSVKSSNGNLAAAGQINTGEQMGVMLPKDSANTKTVDEILAKMEQDGTLKKLASKYLGAAYGIDPNSVPLWTLK